ncbi:hypothetical protein BJV82DRAFT_627199 [Fennellomyces sp. T-0311]|nr:hypothetical protein BJV82DRAFT_627199 [Fennellomyces sp. T-0311]
MVLSIPIYRVSDVNEKQPARTAPLTPSPPTTSSSSFSSSNLEVSRETQLKNHDQRRQLLKQSPSSHRCNKRRYGSIVDHQDAFLAPSSAGTPSFNDSASIKSVASSGSEASFKTATTTTAGFANAINLDMPPTPPHTTVSPNDNDEGLYLLWTHQLLRERGFKPSSFRLQDEGLGALPAESVTEHDYDSDDSRSTDSSLTEGDDNESSLLLTSPDIDHGSRVRMYSSFNSCASSFTGSRTQDYFHHRPSTSSSMHLSAARAAEDDEEEAPSFFASLFGACFSCSR